MRVVWAMAGLLSAASIALCHVPQPIEPGASRARDLPGEEGAMDAPARAERQPVPGPESSSSPAPAPADPNARTSVVIQLCERDSGVPMGEQALRLWLWGREPVALDLRTDRAGMVRVEDPALATATAWSCQVPLPEFRMPLVLGSRRCDELWATSPYRLLVARGMVRTVTVVDSQGRPIRGAWITDHQLHPVSTDADGVGRPCLPDPPPLSLEVGAPGYRVTSASVPPVDQPFCVTLARANRIEVELVGARDPAGHRVELALAPSFVQAQFQQEHYVFTPGRTVEGTPGWWRGMERGSVWVCGFTAEGRAVLDHLADSGRVDVELWYFDELLAQRRVECPPDGDVVRVVFAVGQQAPLAVRVVDAAGAAVPGALLRMGVPGGSVLAPDLERGVPVWCPRATTGADGTCTLPQAAPGVLVVGVAPGRAVTVVSRAELAAHGHTLCLQDERGVSVEVRGRDGVELIEGATTGMPAHVRPRARLAHGLWLDPSDVDRPLFGFRGLARGVVEFRFTHCEDVVVFHASETPSLRVDIDETPESLCLGK